jgi:MFS family permease
MITRSFVLVTLSALAYFTGYAALIPTLPKYVSDPLGGGGLAVGLTVGAFGVTALLMRPFAGAIADRRGRRWLIIGGAGLVALTTLGMIPAGSVGALVGLRLIAGIGEAMFFVGAVTIINDIAVPERRGEAVSLFSVSLYLGIAVGPLLGETVLERVSFDAVWALAAGLSAVAVMFGLAARDDFTPVAVERVPGVRMRVLHPAGVIPGLIMLTSVWGFAGYMAFIRLYAEDLGMRGAASVLVMYGAIMVAIRLFGARIPDVLGVERAGLIGLTLSAAGLATVGLSGSIGGLYAGSVVFALGQSLAFPAFMALAAGSAPPSERGAAIGTTTAFIDLGFAVGPVSLGIIAATVNRQATFLGGAAIACLGVGIQLVARRRRITTPPASVS